MSKELEMFNAALDGAIRAIASKEYMRPVRRILSRYHRQIRARVVSDLSAGLPALGSRVGQAVRGKVYRDGSGFRVYVANNRKLGSGMFATLRPSQPALPLAYWYEHGFTGPRQTRQRKARAAHSTGPDTPREGIHALDREQSELTQLEAALMTELEPYLPNLLDHIHVK